MALLTPPGLDRFPRRSLSRVLLYCFEAGCESKQI
jgi:hypothetical protein